MNLKKSSLKRGDHISSIAILRKLIGIREKSGRSNITDNWIWFLGAQVFNFFAEGTVSNINKNGFGEN